MVVTILTFWNDTVFDPFGTNGVGTNRISTADTAFGCFGTPHSYRWFGC